MSVQLLFLGTGDAFGTGGRLHTATLITTPAVRLLVDCGPSTLMALAHEGISPNDLDAVLITHLHGDHFAGLPFLLMDAHYASHRRRPLTIVGPPGAEGRVAQVQEAFFPGSGRLPYTFPLRWAEWSPSRALALPGAGVTPMLVNHSAREVCFGLRLDCDGRLVAFSGDTAWADSLPDLARQAHVFVCECFGVDSAPPGHLDYATIRRHRHLLTCHRLVLTHLGPDMLRHARHIGEAVAADGRLLLIP